MSQASWQVEERPLDSLENVAMDSAWTKFLPSGTQVLSSEPSGAASFWSRTARINTRLSSGEDKTYFFKLMNGDKGRLMAEGEFESMFALHSIAPEMVPQPLGWGTLETNPREHFFICDYIELADEVPDPSSICTKLAELHRKSIDASSNGKYGFKVTTCNGTFPQDNRWNVSWEAFFVQQFEGALKAEQEVHGRCEEYDKLLPLMYGKVIPRLLRPLETGGNNIKPALIHGDLWDGNVSFHAVTEDPYIYDSSAFWGHNEYDLHNWRAARFKLRKAFIKEYFKHFPMSSPEEDWDDRNLLYSIRADLHDSYLFPSTKRFRALIIAAMKELVEKFPKGYEGPHARKDKRPEYQQSSSNDETVAGAHKADSGPQPDGGIISNGAPKGPPQSIVHSNLSMRQTAAAQIAEILSDSSAPNAKTPDSEIRFGESAISPPVGSETGIQY